MSNGLHDLRSPLGARRPRKRVGRGDGSGRGTYSGRGSKGQKAKENLPPVFEGGQNPLVKKLPYLRGFTNIFRTEYVPVNLARLRLFDGGSDVTPDVLLRKGILSGSRGLVKILGGGDLSVPLNVKAHAFSRSARTKIEAAGGTATVISRVSDKRSDSQASVGKDNPDQ